MIREREYLIKKLKEAGIKSQVYTSMKKLKMAGEMHLGAILHNGDTFERTRKKRIFFSDTGEKMCRTTYLLRNSSFNVVISDPDELKCEEILNTFLDLIGKGLYVDDNWVEIEIGEADWVEKDDSILKAKIAVQIELTFQGIRTYKDESVKNMNIGKIGGLYDREERGTDAGREMH